MWEKRIIRLLKQLNPKDLAKEVHVYGYNFSWRMHLRILLCSFIGIGAIGILFKLEKGYVIVVAAVVVIVLPGLILSSYKRMFEQKRFADAAVYAEQMLYSFQKSEKVVAALKETREIFEEGRMRLAIEEALQHLEIGIARTEKGTSREALAIVEQAYPCVKIHMVHELLCSSEEYGGEVSDSIFLLLNDIELWKRRGYKLQADKKTSHTDNVISILVAAALCAIALYVLNAMSAMFPGVSSINIFTVGIIQLSSFAFILFMLYVFAKSMKSLTANWLESELLHTEASLLSSYRTVVNYEEAKEKRKSLMFSVPFFLLAAIGFFSRKLWLCAAGLGIAVFMLLQHRIGYHMAKKDVNEELYIALPQWLMEIALLLQNNNVQVSIAKSVSEAPLILRIELEQLVARLQNAPEQLSSYTDFCKSFDVPEIQSAMKMLHAISESGTGNAKIQIGNLISRVQEMQSFADEIRDKSIAFRMKMIFSYPVLAATVKLLIDLTVGMIYMFNLLGSMGGAWK